MHAELLVLRLIHVVGGVIWVGTALFNTVFLMPALQQAGPAAAPVMAGLQRRRLMSFLPIVATLTLLSGLRLYWIVSGGFSPAWVHSGPGVTFGAAGLLSIIAFVMGLAVARPAMMRAAQLSQQLASAGGEARAALEAEIRAARGRGASSSLIVTVLLALAAAGMAVARYV